MLYIHTHTHTHTYMHNVHIYNPHLLGVPWVDADGPRQGLGRAGELGQDQHAGALLYTCFVGGGWCICVYMYVCVWIAAGGLLFLFIFVFRGQARTPRPSPVCVFLGGVCVCVCVGRVGFERGVSCWVFWYFVWVKGACAWCWCLATWAAGQA